MTMVMWTCFRFLCCTVPILIVDGLQLLGFVLVLSPGFARFLYYYAAVARRVTLRYDTQSCRQSLDIYFPNDALYQRARDYKRQQHQQSALVAAQQVGTAATLQEDHEKQLGATRDDFLVDELQSSSMIGTPTVIFASGGAWLIGYKMWGCLLARALTARGIVVVLPDYRNYPWGTVPDMVDDVDSTIDWTLRHIDSLGGDKSKVVLVGQSAGGHLGLVSLLRRARLLQPEMNASHVDDDSPNPASNTSTNGQPISWKPTDLSGFLSLSAPFHLSSTESTLRRHGLDAPLVDRMFGHEKDSYDAWGILQSLSNVQASQLAHLLPPMRLFHGSSDRTVPCQGTAAFAAELQRRVRPDILWTVYEGWSHTEAILEGPMSGDDRFHQDIVQAVADWTDNGSLLGQNANARPLCPRMLVRCGKFLMPF